MDVWIMKLFLIAFALSIPVSTFADEPDASSLISVVEDLSSTQSPTQAFSFRMQFPIEEQSTLQFDVGWFGNGDYTLLLSEGTSQVPVALFTRDKFLFHDVIEGKVLVGSGLVPSLEFAAEERNGKSILVISFSVRPSADESPTIDVSLRSLLWKDDAECHLVHRDGGSTLTGPSPSKATIVSYAFENNKSPMFTGMKIYAEGDESHIISISTIKKGTSSVYTPFPELESIPIQTVEWHDDKGWAGALELYHQMLKSVSGIAALSDPKCRELSIFPKDVDWDLVQIRVNEIAAPLSAQLLPKMVEDHRQ